MKKEAHKKITAMKEFIYKEIKFSDAMMNVWMCSSAILKSVKFTNKFQNSDCAIVQDISSLPADDLKEVTLF